MALTPDEQTKLDTLLKSEDGRILQSWKDSQVSNAIRATLEKNPGLPDVAKRIDTIKTEYDKNIKSLEMSNKVLRRCYEKGIDYKTIESLGINFNDEKEIDSKLDLLSKDVELKRKSEFEKLVIENSVKPGMGQQTENSNMYGLDTKTWNSLDKATKAEVAAGYAKKQRAKK
jgi:hypothetical protein